MADETASSPKDAMASFEELQLEVSALLVRASVAELDRHIELAFGRVAAAFDLDRIAMWQLVGAQAYRMTHSWLAAGMAPALDDLSADGFPFIKATVLEQQQPFMVSDPSECPAEAAAEQAHYEREKLQAVLVIPLVVSGPVVGALSFASRSRRIEWTDDLVRRLSILGQLFGNLVGRQRADEALAQSEERFRKMAELLPTIVAELALDGTLTYINQLGQKTFGFSAADLEGGIKAIGELIHPDDRARAQRNIAEVLRGGRHETHEYRGLTKDGKALQLVVRSSAIMQDGQVTGVRSAVDDVTEQKQLRASLAQADRLASMGALAAGVAHEINNPLTYVLYNVETTTSQIGSLVPSQLRLAGAGATSSDAAQPVTQSFLDEIGCQLEDAAEGARRIRDVIKDLMTFSHVDDIGVTPVSINDTVSGAADLLSNEIQFRARLVKDFGPLPKLMANAGKLSQVFLNLLLNAAQAIDEGDVEGNEIRIRTATEGSDIVVEISDTGRGIAPAHLPQVFEPFFTTKAVGMGSGLGLTICHNIVTGYQGDIQVESKEGEGSRFVLRLPSSTGDAQAQADDRPTVEPTMRGRFLVVDDEPQICAAFRRVLSGH
ncbi:MAG: hypothetical protein DRI90_14460, partial [Deltaproteobacteria bacterium]